MATRRLTDAQVSALECRLGGGLDEFPTVYASWAGGCLDCDDSALATLARELCDLSNAEDAQAEATGCKYARRAARSLASLSLWAARNAHPPTSHT